MIDYKPLNEENLSQQLADIPKYKWQEFFRITDDLKNSQKFGEIDGGIINKEGISILPQYEATKEVSLFVKKCYEIPLMVDFDWMSWEEGSNLLNTPKTDYASLPLETLVKLLTAIIRADRFHEGYILSKCEKGSLLGVIEVIRNSFIYK